MNKKDILLILNTNYHVETTLSIYESLRQLGHKCQVLLDYKPQEINPEINDYDLRPFFTKYEIPFLEKSEFLGADKTYDKYIYISGGVFLSNLQDEAFRKENADLVNRTKDSSIFIAHTANYYSLNDLAGRHFNNSYIISVTPYSQKYGLDFLYQIENAVLSQLPKITHPNEVRKFLVLGRFCWYTRNFDYIHEILRSNKTYDNFEIILMGQKPTAVSKFIELEEYKDQTIPVKVKFDVSETDYYNTINESDFLINLIDYRFDDYFKVKFSSNINHSVAFSKPSLCFLGLNLPYNIPSIEYDAHDFLSKFEECLTMPKNDYLNMCDNFNVPKSNMRHHNTRILESLLA